MRRSETRRLRLNPNLRRGLLAQIVEAICPVLEEFSGSGGTKMHRVVRELGARQTSKVTADILLRGLIGNNRRRDVAAKLGSEIFLHLESVKHEEPSTWIRRTRRRFLVRSTIAQYPASSRERIGLALLQIVRDQTELFDPVRPVHQSFIYLVAKPEFWKWVEDRNEEFRKYQSINAPSPVPARLWKQKDVESRIVARHSDLKPHRMPRWLESINRAQRVKWRINYRLAEVFQEAYRNGWPIADLPNATHEKAPIQLDWKHANIEADRYAMWLAKTHALRQTAHRLRNLETMKHLFYRYTACFRGRIYAKGEARIHPQGDDLGRALLEFHDPKPLGDSGAMHLARFGASMWGHRGTMDERVAWIHDNTNMIVAAARDPFACREWEKASDPWKFLAFCLDWESLQRKGSRHTSRLPCQIDGVCNGYQIAALLMKSSNDARLLNMRESEKLYDHYELIRRKVIEYAKQHRPMGQRWLKLYNGTIPREAIKTVVMKRAFGSSRGSTVYDLIRWFDRQGHVYAFHGRIKDPCRWLANTINRAMKNELRTLQRFSSWTTRAMKAWCAKHGVDDELYFVTPLGFRVNLDRRKGARRDKRDEVSMFRSSASHLIHAMDATVVAELLSKTSYDISPIHDCFSAHAGDMERLNYDVREAVIRVFSKPVMLDIADLLEADPPSIGRFRLSSIRKAVYMYS